MPELTTAPTQRIPLLQGEEPLTDTDEFMSIMRAEEPKKDKKSLEEIIGETEALDYELYEADLDRRFPGEDDIGFIRDEKEAFFKSDDFDEQSRLFKARFIEDFVIEQSIAESSFNEASDETKKEIVEDLIASTKKKYPIKFSTSYLAEEEDLAGLMESRTPRRKIKVKRDMPIGNTFDELAIHALSQEDFPLETIDSIELLKSIDQLPMNELHPEVVKKIRKIGKDRSKDLSKGEALVLAVARGAIPFGPDIKGLNRTPEELASIILANPGFGLAQGTAAAASLVAGGLLTQGLRRVLGLKKFISKVAVTGVAEGLLGMAYSDVAPGVLSSLAGKPDDKRLNFMEALFISSMIDFGGAALYMGGRKLKGLFAEGKLTWKRVSDDYPDLAARIKQEGQTRSMYFGGPITVSKVKEPVSEVVETGQKSFPVTEINKKPEVSVTDELSNDPVFNEAVKISKPFWAFKWAREWLTSKGHLLENMYETKQEAINALKAHKAEITWMAKDLDDAIEKTHGTYPMSAQGHKEITEFFYKKGEINPLHNKIREASHAIRNNIDDLSGKLGRLELIPDWLRAIFLKNEGIYVTHDWMSFTLPPGKWAKKLKKIDPTAEGDAVEYFTKISQDGHRPFTPEEAQGIVDMLINPTPGYKSFIDSFTSMTKVQKGILKKRGLFAPPVQRIMGPNKDPVDAVIRTLAKQGDLYYKQSMMEKIYRDNIGKSIFKNPTTINGVKFTTPVVFEKGPAIGESIVNPFNLDKTFELDNGAWTTPELAKALNTLNELPRPGGYAWNVYKWFLAGKGAAHMAKTSLSVEAHSRNALTAWGMVGASGGLSQHPIKSLTKGAKAPLASSKEGIIPAVEIAWGAFAGTKDAAKRKEILKLIKLGIIDQSARVGDMSYLLTRVHGMDLNDVIGITQRSVGKKLLKGAKKVTLDAYQAQDDLPRIYKFYQERKAYRLMRPEWSEEQLDSYVAKIVRNVYPNYGEIVKIIKGLRTLPFGNFLAFNAEIIRNSGHIIELSLKEMRDTATSSHGLQRLLSFALFAGGAGYTMSDIYRKKNDVSVADDWNLRRFAAYYRGNSNWIYLTPIKDGKTEIIDLKHWDPHSIYPGVINAILGSLHETKGEAFNSRVREALIEGVKDFFQPYMEPSLFFKPIAESMFNTRLENWKPMGKVYQEGDDLGEIAKDIFLHIAKDFTPGTAKTITDITDSLKGRNDYLGNPKEVMEEIVGVTAFKPVPIDIKWALERNGKGNKAGISDATQVFVSKTKDRTGKTGPRDIIRSFHDAQKSKYHHLLEVYRDIDAAVSLGVPRKTAINILKDKSKISKADLLFIHKGIFRPYFPTKESMLLFTENMGIAGLSEEVQTGIIEGMKLIFKEWAGIPLTLDPKLGEVMPQNTIKYGPEDLPENPRSLEELLEDNQDNVSIKDLMGFLSRPISGEHDDQEYIDPSEYSLDPDFIERYTP